jgi:thiamine biosynthesis protein ThiS
MNICVNGESRALEGPMDLSALVEMLKFQPLRIAVERNKQLVPRARYAQTVLQEGDVIEIVTLVGGG